jgi:hypothetical protein
MRQCKSPFPRAHKKLVSLPESDFLVIQLQHTTMTGGPPPEEYVTDNCRSCLDGAKQKLIDRDYQVRDLESDLELVDQRDLPIEVVERAIVYLKAPPELMQVQDVVPEQKESNRAAYQAVVAQFPKPPRRPSQRGGGSPRLKGNSVNEQIRRRRQAVESGVWIKKYKQQNGCCGCCKNKFTRQPHLDHDHRTGKVRGLLCNNCNVALGHAMDSIERLEALKAYLMEWQ